MENHKDLFPVKNGKPQRSEFRVPVVLGISDFGYPNFVFRLPDFRISGFGQRGFLLPDFHSFVIPGSHNPKKKHLSIYTRQRLTGRYSVTIP